MRTAAEESRPSMPALLTLSPNAGASTLANPPIEMSPPSVSRIAVPPRPTAGKRLGVDRRSSVGADGGVAADRQRSAVYRADLGPAGLSIEPERCVGGVERTEVVGASCVALRPTVIVSPSHATSLAVSSPCSATSPAKDRLPPPPFAAMAAGCPRIYVRRERAAADRRCSPVPGLRLRRLANRLRTA